MSDLTVSVRDLTSVIRNVFAVDPIAVNAMKGTTRRSGKRAYGIAQELCPVDKGDMKELMRLEFSPDDLLWELGWNDADFELRGVRPHAAYQEFGDGTAYKATPSITPAFHQEQPRFQQEIGKDIRDALERRKVE